MPTVKTIPCRYLAALLPVDLIDRVEDARHELSKGAGRRVPVKRLIQLALEEFLKRHRAVAC